MITHNSKNNTETFSILISRFEQVLKILNAYICKIISGKFEHLSKW